jgi:hypothetical protein
MKKFGLYIAIFGLASILLPFFNLQLTILSWVDNWGETVSWAIKIGLIVIGAVLFFLGKPETEEMELPEDNSAE